MQPAVRNQLQTTQDDRYKWVALANTTAAMFMATPDLISGLSPAA
jgi:hypothetical protein